MFIALEDFLAVGIDVTIGAPIIETYITEFSYIKKVSKTLNDACFALAKEHDVEKILLNMISDKIKNDTKSHSIENMFDLIFDYYDEILFERDLRINKTINKCEYEDKNDRHVQQEDCLQRTPKI